MSDCGCNTYCGTMVKRVVLPIAYFDDAAGGASAAAVLWLRNPSALLSCLVAIVVQGAHGDVLNSIAFAPAAVWQVYPAIPAGDGILEPQILGPVFVTGAGVAAPRALPDGYAILDPTKLAKIEATIAGLKGAAENHGAGTVFAIATWEPTDPRMPVAMWRALSGDAGLSLDGAAQRVAAGV